MCIFECRTELKEKNVSHLKTEVHCRVGDTNEETDSQPEAAKEVPLKVIKQDQENQLKSWTVPEAPVFREEINGKRRRRLSPQVILAPLMGLLVLIGWLFIVWWFFQK
jgi:hypothetical protein